MILFFYYRIIRYFYFFYIFLKFLRIFVFFFDISFRLTPAYVMMVGFYATLLYKIGTGPIWHKRVSNDTNFCRKNWYLNLFYINNFVNVPDMVNYFFD